MPTAARVATPRSTTASKTRSILIAMSDGSEMLVEDIPANAKITFGALQTGKDHYGGGGTAVRIYTTVGNQLAVFRNAVSFRDLTLSVKVKEITYVEDAEVVTGPNGNKSKRNSQTTGQWMPVVNPSF